jgi:hypothetical protein
MVSSSKKILNKSEITILAACVGRVKVNLNAIDASSNL